MRNKILSRKFLSILAAVMLVTVIAIPVLASPATATRTLPRSVESEAEFDITIETSDYGAFGQVIETLPAGFTYVNCLTPDIGVEVNGNTIEFTFLGSANFTYRVRAPAVDTTTTYNFYGVIKDENLNEFLITGDTTINVRATDAQTYTLTMRVHGDGSTTPPSGSHTYDTGTVVAISAAPDSGWRFDRWSGNVTDPDSSSTTVTMNSNKTVIAYFVTASGTRSLPSSVTSGAEFDVAIEASGCGTFGQVVETLPSGFAYVSSSLPADHVEQLGNTLKFTFLGDSTDFTCRIKAPRVAAATTYTFQGIVEDQDRISHPIEDDDLEVLATSGIRTLPALVAPGTEFNVAIEVSGCGAFGQVVETLPSGFAYVSSSLPADQVEQVGNTVKFSFIGNSASFTYRAKAPTVDNDTTYTFHGVVEDDDRISYPIEDDDLTVTREVPSTLPSIGGEGYLPNIAGLLAPWIALGAVLMGGITWFVLRRRNV